MSNNAGNQVNAALIGCGGMMGAHERGYRELWEHDLRTFRIIAVCDVDRDLSERMAAAIEGWQGSRPVVYPRVEELLQEESGLEAVDISVPHNRHHTMALPCIAAGKHVTIEKPLGITMRAAKAILDAARDKGIVFQVAENYRRSPEHRAINWAIRSGRIGVLQQLYWVDVSERLWHWGWRDELAIAGGGWSMDGGVHFADLFRYHVGEVELLYAISKQYRKTRFRNREELTDPVDVNAEDTTMAVLTFENGVTGTWTSTNAAPGHKFSTRAVYGDEGSIDFAEGLQTRSVTQSIDELKDEFMGQLSDGDSDRLFPRGITNTVATELAEFYDAIRTGSPVEITGLEGYKDEALSLALYESEELGAPVRIKDIEDLSIETYQSQFDEGLES